jgi:tetratricopeptide (TPR) repeat protein
MVHMPSHIDVRTGKWALAADQNEMSMNVDRVYRRASPRQEFYSVYMLHNPHFLSFACMMEGRRERALSAAKEVLAAVPDGFRKQAPHLVDPFLSIEYQVLVRFGAWDQLVELPAPADEFPITKAMWRFARATALAAKHDFPGALLEQKHFLEAVSSVPEDALGAINPASDILKVAEHVLNGEIAFQKGEIEIAVAELNKGVEAETRLLYMEPPEWIQPVRHSLGAVLVSAKRWEEAEQVYRDDLEQWPENGWALFGLAQCLRAKKDDAAAELAQRRFEAAWKRADTKIAATCLCVKNSNLSASNATKK